MDKCVFDYYGKCQHSNDHGKATKSKCKKCEDYVNLRISHNRVLIRQLREKRAAISAEITMLLHDIAEIEMEGR